MSVNFKFLFVMSLVSFTELEYISGLNKELGSKLREGYRILQASEVGHRSCRSKLDKNEGTDLNELYQHHVSDIHAKRVCTCSTSSRGSVGFGENFMTRMVDLFSNHDDEMSSLLQLSSTKKDYFSLWFTI